MFFVLLVKALVFASVLPDVLSVPMHNSFCELPVKPSSIRPLENASTTHFVLLPLAFVPRSVCPEVYTLALLDAIFEVAIVVAPVTPNFDTVAVLLFERAVGRALTA